ncbi:MAG: GtrA family protein [Candidatus Gracilibacteria bacterium]
MKKASEHGLRYFGIKNIRVYHHIHQFIRYLTVGGIMLSISLFIVGVFTGIFGLHYLTSCGIAFILESIAAFYINRYWTFGSDVSFRHGYPRFVTIAFYSTVIVLLITYGLTDYFALEYVWARTISTMIMGVCGYFLDMRVAFRML